MGRGFVLVVSGAVTALACSGRPCTELGAEPGVTDIAAAIEPHVVEAFEAALSRLHPVHREALGVIRLERETDLGVPEAAPLMYRLLGRGALASYDEHTRTVTVYDAGASLRPTWSAPAPDRASLADFLAQMADVLGVTAPLGADDPSLDSAWAAFVSRIHTSSGEAPPAIIPPPGDPGVLDLFLNDTVWRALGGRTTLEQLLVHELGHAIQLGPHRAAHMRFWAPLSGWRHAHDGSIATGMHDGGPAWESPMALIRMLMGGCRGESFYTHGPRCGFVTTYARFDPREDFAECVRLMVFDPSVLLETAPAKFLVVNAVGLNAYGDLSDPGPLWMDESVLIGDEIRARVAEGARRLLAADKCGSGVAPGVVAAVLRVHAGVLRAGELPRHGPFTAPRDLPPDVSREYTPDRMVFTIEGVEHWPPREMIEEALWLDLRDWIEGDRSAHFLKLQARSSSDLKRVVVQEGPDVFGGVAAGSVLARRYAQGANIRVALRQVGQIGGGTLGAFERVSLLIEIAGEHPIVDGVDVLDVAEAEARSATLAPVRAWLVELVEGARIRSSAP